MDPTHQKLKNLDSTQPNPTQPNPWVNPTHVQLWPRLSTRYYPQPRLRRLQLSIDIRSQAASNDRCRSTGQTDRQTDRRTDGHPTVTQTLHCILYARSVDNFAHAGYCPHFTMGRNTPISRNYPLSRRDPGPHLIHVSSGPSESTPQTAPRLRQPVFAERSRLRSTDTDRPRNIGNNRPHLMLRIAMRPNNSQ